MKTATPLKGELWGADAAFRKSDRELTHRKKIAQGWDSICPCARDLMRVRLESRLRDGQRPGVGLSVAAPEKLPTTMKTLIRKITDLFLRAQTSREHWTQSEFQFPRRIREKIGRVRLPHLD